MEIRESSLKSPSNANLLLASMNFKRFSWLMALIMWWSLGLLILLWEIHVFSCAWDLLSSILRKKRSKHQSKTCVFFQRETIYWPCPRPMHAQWRGINFWSEVPFEEQEPTYIIESILVQADEQSAITDRHPCLEYFSHWYRDPHSDVSVLKLHKSHWFGSGNFCYLLCPWALIKDIMF